MANSAGALVGAPIRRQPFPGSKLIEHGRMSGEHLCMKRMVETIRAVGRRRRRYPPAAPRDEATVAQCFETSGDRQRCLRSGRLRDVCRAELRPHRGRGFENHTILRLELIEAPED